MGTKVKETCTVLSQECIGKDIYSMWIQTKTIAGNAKPGQFVSVYTQDGSKLLPRPISLCEIDKEKGTDNCKTDHISHKAYAAEEYFSGNGHT